jgi:hypothetical protein
MPMMRELFPQRPFRIVEVPMRTDALDAARAAAAPQMVTGS